MLILVIVMVFAGDYENCYNACYMNNTNCESDCYSAHCPNGSCGGCYEDCVDGCDDGFNSCEDICELIDEDGDGIDDYNDSLIGTHDNVNVEGFGNLSVYVGGYLSNHSSASGFDDVETVEFVSDGKTILEFDQDFTNTSLDLASVEIKHQISGVRQGMVVIGIDNVDSKTLYLEKNRADSSLCIKDADIEHINDVSQDCEGTNEIYFGDCENVETIGFYTCSVESGYYKIQGLKHSGAVEMNISGVYSGFFTAQYHTTMSNHREGYLMPGESITLCFESARSILDDEHLRFAFVPQVGGLTINEMYTPGVISLYNTHIYP